MLAPTIAIVHTHPPFFTLMDDILSGEGYRVFPLPLHDAVRALRSERPTLIILDAWVDVRQDGWDLLVQLRADLRTTDVPVILFADDPQFVHRSHPLLQETRCTVLDKPFELEDLLAAITAYLGPSPVAQSVASWASPITAMRGIAEDVHESTEKSEMLPA